MLAEPVTPARPLWPAYGCECLSSVGTTLLMVGIFFYTEHYLRWGLRQNFLLAAGQGFAYVFGSLAADRISRRLGSRRKSLIVIYAALVLLPLIAGRAHSGAGLVAALLSYTFLAASNWPLLESLVAAGADPRNMNRRIGLYNLLWSGTNVAAFAISGSIIEHWQMGLFIVPAIAHAGGMIVMLLQPRVEPVIAPKDTRTAPPEGAHLPPEPALLAERKLALWLARIALPATYIVVYSLSAMMPLLPIMRPFDTSTRTLIGSAWMASRWLMFLLLGATIWWHTRPRLLLVACAIMLIAFLGVAIRPSDLSGASASGISTASDLSSMIFWQLILGAMMGVIYSGSLYFGMVLSDGSTEHGGYHEALIGLGSILGPGSAAVAQWQWPGNLAAGVTAVSCLLGLTLATACIASLRLRPRNP
jgi:hypothetical protein